MKRKDKNIILILSFVIIIIFVTLIFLFAQNIISFNWNFNDNNSVITDLGEKMKMIMKLTMIM